MKLIQCVWRRRCLNVYNIISQILPGKKHDPAFEQNRNTPPKDALCLVWLKLVKWFRRRLFFNIFNIIYYFAIISPRKRVWSYISTNFNPLHPWMLCAKFGWKWPSGSGKWEKFNDKWTDDKQHVIEKLTWASSSDKLKTYFKKLLFYKFYFWFITPKAQGLYSHLSAKAHNNTAHHY